MSRLSRVKKQQAVLSGSSTYDGERFPATEPFAAWRARSLNFLELQLGAENPYTREFRERITTARTPDAEEGVGILRAVQFDIMEGYLEQDARLVGARRPSSQGPRQPFY